MTAPDLSTPRTGLGDDVTLVPILLRADGMTARVQFPANLTAAEAEKIARVIRAYAEPAPPETNP